MARRLLSFVAAVSSACVACLMTPPPTPVHLSTKIQARVVHDGDLMHVEYTFPEEPTRITFTRPGHGVRSHWKATTPYVVLDENEAHGTLAHRYWAFDIPVGDFQPEKDYRTTYRYTDGSTLFYTGHLAVPKGDELILTAGEGESVIVRGQPPSSKVFTRLAADGFYAYFGKEKPVETPDFVGLIDRGFPAALRAHLDTELPRYFAYFGDGLGRPASAAEKPLLFASYHELANPDGLDVGGGVMPPRTVNVDIGIGRGELPSWKKAAIDYMLAHETAHLCNDDAYAPNDARNETWLKEGTADALAFRAMRASGAYEEAGYRARLDEALSLCILGLSEGEPLSASMRPGHTKDFYECGSTLALLTEASLKKGNAGLLGFLREVYAGPDNTYDAKRWYDRLDATTADVVRRTAEEKLAEPERELVGALRAVGLEVKAGTPTARYQARAAASAMRAVFVEGCAEALKFGGSLSTEPEVTSDACVPAEKGDRFASLAGVALAKDGAGAFDAAVKQCATRGLVEVGRKDGSYLRMPCRRPVRSRPAYYEISKAP